MTGEQFDDAARVWNERFSVPEFVFGKRMLATSSPRSSSSSPPPETARIRDGVEVVNAEAVLQPVERPESAALAKDVRERLDRVLAAV